MIEQPIIKRKPITLIIVCGLFCLTLIECIALCNKIDGYILTAVVAVIATVIGVAIPTPRNWA